MGTNCAPLFDILFLYSYENDFFDNTISCVYGKLARSLNLRFQYIDDLIVFNKKKVLEYVKDIYTFQLNVEKTNQSDNLGSYFDLTFAINRDGKLSTKLCDKRDNFDFHMVNFPLLSNDIASGPSL